MNKIILYMGGALVEVCYQGNQVMETLKVWIILFLIKFFMLLVYSYTLSCLIFPSFLFREITDTNLLIIYLYHRL